MNTLTAYITKEVIKGSLIAVLFLLTLYNLFTFSDEIDDIGKGAYGLKELFYYLALTSPTVFYELMPSSALLGSLFILGAMGNNRELIAMQAAGLSVIGIIKAVMTAGSILVVITVLVGEFVAPLCERTAQLLMITAKNQQVIKKTRYGIWLREGEKFVNIRNIEENGDLLDVSIYERNPQNRLRRVIHADRAVFSGNREWKLQQTKESLISTARIEALHQNENILKSSIAPDILKITVVNQDNLSLVELAKYVSFLKANHQKSQSFEMAFWRRLVNPLITFVMLFVSAPFVIGIKRGVSVGARMVLGVVIGFGFYLLDNIAGHLGLIYNLNPPVVAIFPSFVVLAAAYWGLRRSRV